MKNTIETQNNLSKINITPDINDLNQFINFNLPKILLDSLHNLNYITATPIQTKTIPLALDSHDILGSAHTGTGKTLAFIIPLITHLINNPKSNGLILTPTRELSEQTISIIKKLCGVKFYLKSVLLIGGEPIFKQLRLLKSFPRIIVGTPGRVIDHLSRKSLHTNFNFLVLDETDRMLDMGFGIQLEKIISQLPKERQTLMFSATFPKHAENLANKYLKNPKRIAINTTNTTISNLEEETIKVTATDKFSTLLNQIEKRSGTIIIFVKTKDGAENLSKNLYKKNYKVNYMHGDLKQHKRSKVIEDFRNGRCQIMVATDVAARGLDVPHIQHVINYDLPNSPEDYVHRVGRTARAGAKGSALNLICNQDQAKWGIIQRFINPEKFPATSKNTVRKRIHLKNNNFNSNFKSNNKSNQSKVNKFKKFNEFTDINKHSMSRNSTSKKFKSNFKYNNSNFVK